MLLGLNILFEDEFKIVAKLGPQVIGSLTFKAAKERNLELEWLEVENEYKRQGVATSLIQFFLSEAYKKYPNLTWISFWTGRTAELENTWKLYQKNGFEQVYIQDDYYSPGVPTRLFVKKFPGDAR